MAAKRRQRKKTIECPGSQIMVVHRGRSRRCDCTFSRPDFRLLCAAGPRVRTGSGQPRAGHDSGDIIRWFPVVRESGRGPGTLLLISWLTHLCAGGSSAGQNTVGVRR